MFKSVTLELLKGFAVTLELFVATLVLALPLGLIVAFGSMSKFKPVKYVTKGFVWVIRGTPLMLQILVIFFIPGILFDFPVTKWAVFKGNQEVARFTVALIAFSINYAAYFSEIYRAGIENMPRGQYEAGYVLGMTKAQVFFRIILKQVVKNVLPPVSNEIVTLVKDTALARIITIVEVIMVAQVIMAKDHIIWPLFYTGAFYLIFNALVQLLLSAAERKLSYYRS